MSNGNRKQQTGFTLIELMIVVAIIGVLASISLPLYQNYVQKSQTSASLAEISALRTSYDVAVAEGKASTFYTLENFEITANSQRCSEKKITAPAANDETIAAISCKMIGSGTIQNAVIRMDRTKEGAWSCKIANTVKASVRPASCSEFIP